MNISPPTSQPSNVINLLGSNQAFSAEASNQSTGGSRKVTAVVIGSGFVGIAAASQLYGLELIHNKSVCQVLSHKDIPDNGLVYLETIPLPGELSTRGLFPSGNWFDRFLYHEEGHRKSCLKWRINPDRRVDTVMVSSSAPGGSWNFYHPEQLSASPYLWMELPDWPIDNWLAGKADILTRASNPERRKITGHSLCKYYSDYVKRPEFLPPERVLLNRNVQKLARLDNNEWQVTISDVSSGTISVVECKYVVLACGRMKPVRHEAEDGAELPNIVHTSGDARKRLETLPRGSKVLLVGKGMSAADVLTQVRLGQHHVTHLIPEQNYTTSQTSSSRVLEKMKDYDSEYPDQFMAYRLFNGLHAEPGFYTRRDKWNIKSLSHDGCVLAGPDGEQQKQIFDLICIVIGSKPDFSMLGLSEEKEQELLTSLDGHTMETMLPNLFLAGMSTGEPFQRFSYGHAVAAVETVKAREFTT